MNVELKNKIRDELNRAFTHCGEADAEVLNEKVENELETLTCFMVGSDPNVIHTDKGEMTGYVVNIAVGSGAAKGEIVALEMIVTKNEIVYVIHSHTSIKPDGRKPGDRKMITNESNRVVELTDVNPAIFY